MSNVIIIDAVAKDAEAIREVSRVSWIATFPSVEHGITKEDIEHRFAFKTIEDKEKLLEDRRKKIADPFWHYWVAKDEDRVVGFCIARIMNEKNRLEAIHLLPWYHRQGIGTNFMEKALLWLGKEKEIVLGVAVYNEKAIRFYEKLKFKKTGKAASHEITTLPSGRFIPQIEMALKF